MKIQELAGIKIDRSRPFLILEAGVNHEESLDKAFEMVDAAAKAGADVIKFQSYKAETLASRNSPAYWDQTKETTSSQYELFKKHDSFGDEEYRQLSQRCQQQGILFCSTPFDDHFVDFLDELMPFYKVASADITNLPLLRKIASKNKPVLLSVGASYLPEIHQAIEWLQQTGAGPIALLHCVLEYPTLIEHANLETIAYLQSEFPDMTIGFSDHVTPSPRCTSLLAAWLKGADILEKHYTLDKTLPGNDHYHAMDPDDVREFVHDRDQIGAMLGTFGKTVLTCEEIPRKFARRSLVAAQDIACGSVITEAMIIAKRPGTGISPEKYDEVIGKVAKQSIKEDDVLTWDMI
ncbi:MAG: N-acetylneuraminate synthase family protein [Planctomycetota bacterium]|jgi:N-acetylneuraminate synthase